MDTILSRGCVSCFVWLLVPRIVQSYPKLYSKAICNIIQQWLNVIQILVKLIINKHIKVQLFFRCSLASPVVVVSCQDLHFP